MALPFEMIERLGMRVGDIRDPFLRKIQARYDTEFFDEQPYALELKGVSHPDAKVAHIASHVAKLAAKYNAHYRSGKDCGTAAKLNDEVVPDALIYRTQLANTLRFDLAKHLGTKPLKTSFPHETAIDLLFTAQEVLFAFAEPLEHQPAHSKLRSQVRELAIPALHSFGLLLAAEQHVLPHEAHASRLMRNIVSNRFIKPDHTR